MTKVAVVVEGTPSPKQLMDLQRLTGASLKDVRTHLDAGTPVYERLLFMNDHDDVAATLRGLVDAHDRGEPPMKFFELEDDEDVRESPSETQVTGEELLNVLAEHDRRMQED